METMDAIRKHNKSWFYVFFNSSAAIEIENTKVEATSGNEGKKIRGNNIMTLYKTSSGHTVLERNLHWPIFGVTKTIHTHVFNAVQSYCDESALVCWAKLLDSSRLQKKLRSYAFTVNDYCWAE